MSVTLSHYAVFGIKGDVANCVIYLDESTLVFPAGNNVVIYNLDTKVQKFISGSEKGEGITGIAISPNHRFLAVAEKSDRAMVTIWDVQNLKKRKVLQSTDIMSREFVSVEFSPDSRFLITQGGSPDWSLVFWSWEKAKILAIAKQVSQEGMPIKQCSFHPTQSNLVCAAGFGVFKFFKYSDQQLKVAPGGMGKREPQNYTAFTWLTEDHLIVGTDQGDLILLENFEYRQVLSQSPADGLPILAIAPMTRGFIMSSQSGVVSLYERREDKEPYHVQKSLQVTSAPISSSHLGGAAARGALAGGAGEGGGDDVDEPGEENLRLDAAGTEAVVDMVEGGQNTTVRYMAVNPSEEMICCVADDKQIYVISLASTDMTKAEELVMSFLADPLHAGAIVGLDTCGRKPIIATACVDKTVRVWNWHDRSLSVVKQFAEECFSVALHPSGHYMLLGFSDKLRLMTVMIDDIRVLKEFPIKSCREVVFSNGGQYFAAVNGNTVQIFNSYTFENTGNLRGHNGKVRSVWWSPDDTRLTTCGIDGAVYGWKLKEFRRDSECVLKTCSYTSACATRDSAVMYAVGSDRMLKEITESAVSREIALEPLTGRQVAITTSQRALLVGTDKGTIRMYRLPFAGADDDFVEYQAHSAPVSRMRLTNDDQMLFSTGEDGSVYCFELHDPKDMRAVARRGREVWSEEVLTTRSDLEEKNQMVNELKVKVDELTMQTEYQLRLKDLNYNERVKELTDKFQAELDAAHANLEVIQQEKADMEMEYERKAKETQERHQQAIQEIETQYQHKIMAEVDRYGSLQQEKQMLIEKMDEQNQMLVEGHERVIQELTEDYENKLQEVALLLEKAIEEKEELTKEFEETRRQIEEDADSEIEDLKKEYEGQLSAEREEVSRLKGENGILRKKFSTLQKNIDAQKEEIKQLFEQKKGLYANIASLEKDIAGLKKEIKERDETIGDKEKRIYDLKKKNQELEKFKFVLDYKIKELKKQIEPREQEIADMREQIREMDLELEKYHRQNGALELQLSDLKLKLEGVQKEVLEQRSRLAEEQTRIRRFEHDLHLTVEHLQNPKALKDAVKQLHEKYITRQIRSDAVDVDIQEEYARQREHLERTVESLRRKLDKDVKMHKAENMRVMQENVQLIKEINDLRREIKALKQQQRASEMGALQKSGFDISRLPPEAQREFELQREELQKLRERLAVHEGSGVANRPLSREKLPAVDSFGGV